MAPIRGSRKKIKVDDKEEQSSMPSGSAEEVTADWWEVLSKRLAGHLQSEDLDSFESLFKMSRRTFDYICSLTEEQMKGKFRFSNGTVMSVNDQVAIALTRLSSGKSLCQVGELFGAHHSTVSQLTWRFVEAIEENGLCHIRWPSTEQELTQTKSKFQKFHGLPNCCGAIDTTHIIMQLCSTDRGGDLWRDRVNNHSMILQAIVDPNLRFLDITAGLPGQMTEKSVLQSSNFFQLCEKGERLNGAKMKLFENTELREYIIGDSAFPLLPWLITPYQENELLPEHKVEFNKRHLAAHMVAQRALARLKDVWKVIEGTLWRPDKHRLPRFVLACCILHNIVIDREDNITSKLPISNDHDPGYPPEVCKSVDKTSSILRNELARYLSWRRNS